MAMATVMVKANLARLQHDRFAARLNRASTGWAMGVHYQGMPPTAVVDQIEGDNMICGLRWSTRKDPSHLKSRPVTSHHSATGGLQRPWDPIQGRLPHCGSKPLHLALAHEQAAQAGPTARLLGVEQRAQPELTAVGFHKEPASPLLAKALIQDVQVRMKVGLTHNQGEISLSIRINHSQTQAG
jgi:hypothetical protein